MDEVEDDMSIQMKRQDQESSDSAMDEPMPGTDVSKTPLLKDGSKKGHNYASSSDNASPTELSAGSAAVNDSVNVNIKPAAEKRMTCFVYILTFLSAIGGFLFGYDTGVVSGAMLLLREYFQWNSFYQELVVSVTVGAAALFSIVGGFLNDSIGRKPTIISASFVFTVGAILLGAAKDTVMILVGRIIVGTGIGFASMTVPMYIAESSPPHLRGRLVTVNNLFITGGQFFASLVDGLFSKDKLNGWRFMLGLAGIPALVQFIGFIFMPESPRWLITKGKDDKAREILRQIRGQMDVEEEMSAIKTRHEEETVLLQAAGRTPIIIQILKTPHVRRALVVGCGLQMFQQICGINTVMYYSASIIKMSGVKDSSVAIWLASVTAGTNFLFTIVGLYLVEKIGRRPLTLGSLMGTAASLAVLAVGFQLAAFNSPPVSYNETLSVNFTTKCASYKYCDPCISDAKCGFCFDDLSSGVANASCLPAIISPDQSDAGRCDRMTLPGDLTWAKDYCPTAYSWMALFGLILYLAFFAPGMGPMPWTINSEIYPLWARSTGNATATCVNWVFNLLISMTFLTLTEAITRYGAFWLYTSFAVIGVIFVFLVVPETKGKSLEEVEVLFKKPWCS